MQKHVVHQLMLFFPHIKYIRKGNFLSGCCVQNKVEAESTLRTTSQTQNLLYYDWKNKVPSFLTGMLMARKDNGSGGVKWRLHKAFSDQSELPGQTNLVYFLGGVCG